MPVSGNPKPKSLKRINPFLHHPPRLVPLRLVVPWNGENMGRECGASAHALLLIPSPMCWYKFCLSTPIKPSPLKKGKPSPHRCHFSTQTLPFGAGTGKTPLSAHL